MGKRGGVQTVDRMGNMSHNNQEHRNLSLIHFNRRQSKYIIRGKKCLSSFTVKNGHVHLSLSQLNKKGQYQDMEISALTSLRGPKSSGTDSISSSFQTGFKLLFITVV